MYDGFSDRQFGLPDSVFTPWEPDQYFALLAGQLDIQKIAIPDIVSIVE